MLQDIENGRRTEIDHINGAFSRLGEKQCVAVPLNRTMTAMVRALKRNALEGKG
jgi:2-dehydropantoate 2-reductase